MIGRETRSSVGSTTVAVAIVCAVGFLSYLLVEGDIYWRLVAAACIGSIIATPFAALTVKKANTDKLRFVIGLAIVMIGVSTLARTFIF